MKTNKKAPAATEAQENKADTGIVARAPMFKPQSGMTAVQSTKRRMLWLMLNKSFHDGCYLYMDEVIRRFQKAGYTAHDAREAIEFMVSKDHVLIETTGHRVGLFLAKCVEGEV
ncbi:hypothetical protein CFI10_09440 [Marinobacterium iners]|uniref:hypothetical protein n=1 Tax=Marinobacterium iners TaxID=48076 RepID=UPI001A8C9E41|nr:hypothetical protein [Marinobacterium iners]QSR35216.1 hypothetical protein CFI10_09440 [Marinobacterium iners]